MRSAVRSDVAPTAFRPPRRSTIGAPRVQPRPGPQARRSSAPLPLDATLARAVRERAEQGRTPDPIHVTGHPATPMLARFWIKEGGAYRWEADDSRKVRYIETSERRGSWYPWRWKTPVYIPPADVFALSHDNMIGVPQDEVAEFDRRLFADLDRITTTAIGRRLLASLLAARHRTTLEPSALPRVAGPVTESPRREGNDPSDPLRGAPPTISIEPGAAIDALALVQRAGEGEPPEAAWNPTASHVALFHELVHAYHYANGTKAAGRLTAQQAIHAGDVGVSMSEYQATGLNTADGEQATRFAAAEFTENAYRAALRLPRRDTYIPTGYRVPQGAPTLVFT